MSRRYDLGGNGGAGDAPLLELVRRTEREQRPVLFPDSDWSLEFVMRNWDAVRPLVDLPLPDDLETIDALRRKERLPAIAAAAGVSTPATAVCTGAEELAHSAVPFPALVKPVEGKWFEAAFAQKAFLARNLDEALAAVERAQERGIETILQELIPGAHERLYSLFVYIGRDGAALASVVGRKVRQLPVDFGSATVLRVEWRPEVYELGMRVLSRCGYRGFAHVELALDERDGHWKLIEVNPRVPQWVSVAIRKGFNIATIAYDDLIGAAPRGECVLRDPVAWVDLRKDLVRAARARDLHALRFAAPYLSPRTAHAVFARDDLRPIVRWDRRGAKVSPSGEDAGGTVLGRDRLAGPA